jgi:mono/diheme cytochrome c family protein
VTTEVRSPFPPIGLAARQISSADRLLVVLLALVALLRPAAAAPPYSRKEDVKKGKDLFQLCLGCHSAESEEKRVGPSLKGVFKRNKLRDGQPVTEKNVRIVIEKGRDGMPSFGETLSPQQMDQLIAYLKEL